MGIANTTELPSLLSPSKPSPNTAFIIPKNISVTLAPFLAQRRKDVWGEDAEIFSPSRWLLPPSASNDHDAEEPPDYTHLTHVSNPFSFIPFNAGPRVCLGQSFALMECSYVLVRLLQRFPGKWDLVEGKQLLPVTPGKQANGDLGRQSWERCWPRASLTLYVEVRVTSLKGDSMDRKRSSDISFPLHREGFGLTLGDVSRMCSHSLHVFYDSGLNSVYTRPGFIPSHVAHCSMISMAFGLHERSQRFDKGSTLSILHNQHKINYALQISST